MLLHCVYNFKPSGKGQGGGPQSKQFKDLFVETPRPASPHSPRPRLPDRLQFTPLPPGSLRPAPAQTCALSLNAENQSPSVSTFSPFSASALSQNGGTSEVTEAPAVAEAGPEAAERIRKLPKESSG